MKQSPGLEKENSELIGFVLCCLFSSAINRAEFRQWCQLVIRTRDLDDIPDYIFELESFSESLRGIYEVIGFNPGWKHTESEALAVFGIAARRGVEVFDWPVPPDAALRILAKNPHVSARFRETFPFIRTLDPPPT
jgi:hypothetical protein